MNLAITQHDRRLIILNGRRKMGATRMAYDQAAGQHVAHSIEAICKWARENLGPDDIGRLVAELTPYAGNQTATDNPPDFPGMPRTGGQMAQPNKSLIPNGANGKTNGLMSAKDAQIYSAKLAKQALKNEAERKAAKKAAKAIVKDQMRFDSMFPHVKNIKPDDGFGRMSNVNRTPPTGSYEDFAKRHPNAAKIKIL